GTLLPDRLPPAGRGRAAGEGAGVLRPAGGVGSPDGDVVHLHRLHAADDAVASAFRSSVSTTLPAGRYAQSSSTGPSKASNVSRRLRSPGECGLQPRARASAVPRAIAVIVSVARVTVTPAS